jgi:hypothetical protein
MTTSRRPRPVLPRRNAYFVPGVFYLRRIPRPDVLIGSGGDSFTGYRPGQARTGRPRQIRPGGFNPGREDRQSTISALGLARSTDFSPRQGAAKARNENDPYHVQISPYGISGPPPGQGPGCQEAARCAGFNPGPRLSTKKRKIRWRNSRIAGSPPICFRGGVARIKAL